MCSNTRYATLPWHQRPLHGQVTYVGRSTGAGFQLDNTMALYGSVPLMLALTPSGLSTGIFWLNAAESFIDIVHGDQVLAASSTRSLTS
jgi:hypothetical protein